MSTHTNMQQQHQHKTWDWELAAERAGATTGRGVRVSVV